MIELTVTNKKGKPVKLRSLNTKWPFPSRQMYHNGKWRNIRGSSRYLDYLKAAELISNE